MNAAKILGILLIVGGLLGVAYGGFDYTQETHKADLGPIAIKVEEKETVNVPLWASIAAIVAGSVILVAGGKRS